MTDRRAFVRGAGIVLLGASLQAGAQRAGTLPRIGFLTPGPNPREPAFWQGMRDLGYVDGKSMAVDRRSAEGDLARLPALAVEIVKNRPDIIVAIASASGGRLGGTRALSALRLILSACHATVIANQLALSFADDAYDETDRLKHSADSETLKALVRQLIDVSQRMM